MPAEVTVNLSFHWSNHFPLHFGILQSKDFALILQKNYDAPICIFFSLFAWQCSFVELASDTCAQKMLFCIWMNVSVSHPLFGRLSDLSFDVISVFFNMYAIWRNSVTNGMKKCGCSHIHVIKWAKRPHGRNVKKKSRTLFNSKNECSLVEIEKKSK